MRNAQDSVVALFMVVSPSDRSRRTIILAAVGSASPMRQSAISGGLEAAGRDRVGRLSPTALQADVLVLHAKALMSKYIMADNEETLACAERAVELDPTSAKAHTHAFRLRWALTAAAW